MAKTKKKEVQKPGLRPSQKAKAEKLRKKQEAKALQNAATTSVLKSKTTKTIQTDATSSLNGAATTTSSLNGAAIDKGSSDFPPISQDKECTASSISPLTGEMSAELTERVKTKIITVKNAEGKPDTVAEILIQNKIDYTPKVSVVMPVYNVEPYLRQCLDSVINQTLKEIEIICVDDGSTDASLDILREYAAKDNRITVITQKNLYAGVARNAGLSQAKGEYLSFLDSDDFFEPTLLEETYNLAEKEQSQIVFYQYKNYNHELQQCEEDARGINKRLTSEEHITVTTISMKDDLFTLCNPMPWNKLIYRNLAVKENLHFQALKASNDVCFSLNVLACAEKITLYYKSLVYYRHNRKDSLKNTRDKAPLNFYEAYKGIYNTLKEKGLYERYKKTFLTSLISSSLWTLANTDEKHQLVKDFIKDEIIPKYIKGNENVLNPALLNKLKRVYHPDIIVSLTSYPARINTVNQTIESLLNQSMPADKVILWLAPEQFPNKEADLPQELLDLKEKGLLIDWYHDIRSYKKLIPALKKYPEAIIITADDDLIFNWNFIYLLFKSYIESPEFIHCHRITRMYNYVDESLRILPRNLYLDNKKKYIEELCLPSAYNKLSGGAGTLFPPHCFATDICNEKLFMKLATTSDDIWFWLMGLLNGYRVKVVKDNIYELKYVEGTQEVGLFNINDVNGNKVFYEHFSNIINHFPQLNKEFITDKKQNSHLVARLTKKDIENKALQLRRWYQKVHHKSLNLNNPKTYNEKMQWLKLYGSTPLRTLLADKYLVRNWVKERIGEQYLIPLLGVYDSFDEIDFEKLPKQFVIKCNHGCGYNIIVRDKSKLDLQEVKEKLNKWIKDDFSTHSFELHYRDIKRKIIIEKFIENEGTDDLYDYKFWCFNGKLEYIQFLSERNLDGLKMAFYDKNWIKQKFVYSHPLDKKTIEKPNNLNLMIDLAEKLSKDFPHARVDFYRLNDGTIYFGEITFTSASGTCEWNDEAINKYFGRLIKLPKQAYNIDTGTYYSLPSNNFLKRYFLLPYYWFKNISLAKKYNELLTDSIKPQILASRIDIKNKGFSSNALIISKEHEAQILVPSWLSDQQGIGQIIQYDKIYNRYNIEIIGDGKLVIDFRAQDKRYNEKRIQLWVDYKSIKVDGKEILSQPISVWINKPYRYEMPVKDGQEITLEIEQQYHQYTENELKDLLIKLNPDSDYIYNNIEAIITELKKQLPIINEEVRQKKQIEDRVTDIFNNLTLYRLDIKNFGLESNTLKLEATNDLISEPKWATNTQGIGKMIQGNAMSNIIKLKAINDGTLRLDFRGQDKRSEAKRFPLWIDYKSIKIDGKEILPMPIATWHDKPYRYEMPVKDGQEITVEIEQQYHQYTKEELKDVISKLNIISDEQLTAELLKAIYQKINSREEEKIAA